MPAKIIFRLMLTLTLLMANSLFAQEPTSATTMAEPDNTPQAVTPRGPIPINRILAIVNNDIITQKELNDAMTAANTQLKKQGIESPDTALMEKQVLESLVVKRIQLQRARDMDLSVSDSELDETLKRIARENKMTVPEFYAVLEEDKINFNTFRKEIRNEILLMRLKERVIRDRVKITEGEVDQFLRTQETSAVGNDEYRIAHILVALSEQSDMLDTEEKRKRAEAALAKLKSGVEFAQVAAEFSDSSDALKGGVLEWRPIAQMGQTFAELLATLEINQITDVIRSPAGFHIFKVLGRRAQEVPVVIINQTKARHILIKVNELTSESDARQRINEFKASIENGADFAELAKLHSEDGSASSGGDLGWVSPGDTVPAFEQAMDALQPGEISDAVKSPFGWHLIQVVERRDQDISKERQRQAARQAIQARKADVVVQDWLRQMRDRAYVEYIQDDSLLD